MSDLDRTTPRYPDIAVQLTGTSGNAFSILAIVTRAMRQAGVDKAEIAEFLAEAKSGSYDELIQCCIRWVDVDGEANDD